MPRQTPGRAMAALVALAGGFAGLIAPPLLSTAEAQLPPSKYDRLQRTLEEKFAPPKQQPAPRPPSRPGTDKGDFIYIDPAKKDPPRSTDPSKRSSASWTQSVVSFFTSFGGASNSTPDGVATANTTLAAAETTTAQGAETGDSAAEAAPAPARASSTRRDRNRERSERRYQRSSRKPARLWGNRQQERVPIARPNSYVIQLSPDASDTDIEDLLKKYGLKITKLIAPLGVITVESLRPQPVVPETPGALPKDTRSQLKDILEPPIIRDLRDEKIVDGAFVNTTMETKHLPRPAGGASITVDGEVFSWRWNAGDGEDGNWGLKKIRMPPVWTVLQQHRKAHPDTNRPKIGVIDGGFTPSPMLPFGAMENVRPLSFHTPGCGTHHGMHVAGIIGARQVDGPGIDGMVPDARLDAIAVDDALVGDSGVFGIDEGWQVHTLLFSDVVARTFNYVYANLLEPESNLRVINVSLGYNFVAANLLGDAHPKDIPELVQHIAHQASIIRQMADKLKGHVLFVVAAGNDSDDREDPIEAKWASPFAWAGTQDSAAGPAPPNILVIEASDHDGLRAEFSNTGGHLSAPGVDIMSTLGADRMPIAVCSGTSQAAPHVSALAAILFELAPEKTPSEIAQALRETATPAPEGEELAATIDALEAVAEVAPDAVRLLADLDGDGVVGPSDLALFSRQLESLATAATANTPFTEDLNGDGVIDDNECFWPRIDLNGSGYSGLTMRDARRLGGGARTDLAAIELFWTDTATPFGTAVANAGLATPPEIYAVADSNPGPITQCRRLIGGPVVAQVTETPTVAPGGGSSTPLATTTPSGGGSSSSAQTANAGEVKAEVESAIETLRKQHPNLRVKINPATGLPSSVLGISPLPGSASLGAGRADGDMTEEETKRAVESFFGDGGLGALYPSKNKRVKTEYTGRRKDPDFPDRYVADVEQRIDGVPVFGSTGKLSVSRSLGVTKFSGTTSAVAIETTTPKIAEGEAVAAARAKLKEVIRTSPDASRAFPLAPDPDKVEVAKPNLVVFDPALIGKPGGGQTRLAWMVSIDSFRIFVDAETGEAFYYYRDQHSGMLRRIYDLSNTTAFPGAVGIDETERKRSDTLSAEALTAFRNAGIVRDYFFINFGRNSFDDKDGSGGSPLEAYVRYGRTQNAYWCTTKSYDCPKGNVMVYGPGYADALDIVAHEMTHGIIVHEKNLLYLNEPGAVNEALADIFGALIELDARGAGGNWLIGENSPGFSVTSPLRSLADPNLRDANGLSMFNRTARFTLANRGQPDHYSEVLTPADTLCGSTAYNDNGCVHFNSGILNKFAYLIAEGGTHRGVTVKGIGRNKLARVTYRAMTVGMNQSSTLAQAANAFVEGCYELASGEIAGLSQTDCNEVISAQIAVGLEVPSS